MLLCLSSGVFVSFKILLNSWDSFLASSAPPYSRSSLGIQSGWGLWSKYYWSTRDPDANTTCCWFKLFYSQTSTQLQILWVFTGRVLTNDCSLRHSSPESICANSRYRSHLDHFLVTRPNDSGNRDSSKSGGTNTAARN